MFPVGRITISKAASKGSLNFLKLSSPLQNAAAEPYVVTFVSPLWKSTIKYKSTSMEEPLDEPIKFSTSKAATFKSKNLFMQDPTLDSSPSYQPVVITLSIAIFLLYFCILREENDIDQKLDQNLHTTLAIAEKEKLRERLRDYIKTGEDTSVIRARLVELNKIIKASTSNQDMDK